LRNKSLVLLSGEGTTIPKAEAESLFRSYDPASSFQAVGVRVLIATSTADPYKIGSRIAFARRVGRLVEDKEEVAELLLGHRVRFRCFDFSRRGRVPDPEEYLIGIDSPVDLRNPEYELTLVRGEEDYLAVTAPATMRQSWSSRRPRSRPFFHPSAIFPKLSRALVNLSGCKEGEVFLDPFSGTGSIPIEAHILGARVVAMDQAERMTQGSVSNMKHFGQDWLGVVRADSTLPPLSAVDAIATDIPYGRASSSRGRAPRELLGLLLPPLARILKPGSRLVLMHPQEVPVEEPDGFALDEEHHLHVHKLLTRTISVLRRR